MSAEAYFPRGALYVGHDAARDCPGRPSAAMFWTPPTDRSCEMTSMYPRSSFVGGGASAVHHVCGGIASPPASLLQSLSAEMASVVHGHGHGHAQRGAAVVGVPLAEGHTRREFEQPASTFGVGQDPSGDTQRLGGASSHAVVTGFIPWGDSVESGFVAQAHPLRHPPSWESPTPPSPSLTVGTDPSRAPAEEDDEVYTFLCEWTDEHGTCNMTVYGDRVWMSHHLSRRHNVVGQERTPRACLWRGCTETMNKGSLARHVVSCHLRAGASCGFCSKVYSRVDVARRHARKCKVATTTGDVGGV